MEQAFLLRSIIDSTVNFCKEWATGKKIPVRRFLHNT